MSLCVIELNDSGIRVAKDSKIVLESPGYAIVDKHHIEVGRAALEVAHLHPQRTLNRFWQQLDQVPLRKPSKRCRHHADLAFLQLESVYKEAGSPGEVVFAVPGSFSNDQLSLLLGVAQACRMNPVGLVDAAVASAAALVGPGTYTHIDIQQHQTVLTELDIADHVTRTRVECSDVAALNKIHAACIAEITDAFLEQSRFDTLHHADTEQQLYNQLPHCLEKLKHSPEIVVTVTHGGSPFEARITREALLRTLMPFYSAIENRIRPDAHCIVDDRLCRLPGFTLSRTPYDRLPPEVVFTGCREQIATIRAAGEGVGHLTRLPATTEPTITTRPAAEVAGGAGASRATHILGGHRAYALSSEPLFLSARGHVDRQRVSHSVCGVIRERTGLSLRVENGARVLLNGTPVADSSALKPGDRITFEEGDGWFTPITVIDADAS